MPSKVWDEITYPFPNFNSATIDILGMDKQFHPTHYDDIVMDVIINPCWD